MVLAAFPVQAGPGQGHFSAGTFTPSLGGSVAGRGEHAVQARIQ